MRAGDGNHQDRGKGASQVDSQAQKQPVQIEAGQRLQERFIKKMTLSGLCLKILRGVYRVGRELGLD